MQERVAGIIKELQPLIQVSIRDRCHVISIVALRGYSGVVERRRCVRSRGICLLDSIRCGYTGHFYRGKLPFYHGKLYLAV